MKRTAYKILFFFFALLSIGSLMELLRILTSQAPGIAIKRLELFATSLVFTLLILLLTRYFWKKAKE